MKSFRAFIAEAKVTDKKHVQNYTDLSRPLTRELWKHHKEGTQPPQHVEGHDLEALDRITTKSHLTKNMELYSGVRHNPMDHVDADGHMHIPAYTSTSEHYSVAHKFAVKQARRGDADGKMKDGHIIKFQMKKGQHAVSLAKNSLESHEAERLLPRNIKVKVHPHPETRVNSEGRTIHEWTAHQV